MEPFYVGVSTAGQADAVYAEQEVPVFALADHAFSGLRETKLNEINTSRPFGVLLNRLYRETELARLQEILNELAAVKPERIWFADPAVLTLCDESMRSRLVYRPETLMTSCEDIRFWEETGIRGVTVSPLLTAEELYRIAETEPGAEFVIHGHLLMSVSARKLLSSWAKQYAVRLPDETLYLREETRNDRYPIRETAHGTMIFTDYVLESFDYIKPLAEHGASAFYLDGSFLTEEHLISALRLYRSVLHDEDAPGQTDAWRTAHPECTEGYYGQETIL